MVQNREKEGTMIANIENEGYNGVLAWLPFRPSPSKFRRQYRRRAFVIQSDICFSSRSPRQILRCSLNSLVRYGSS